MGRRLLTCRTVSSFRSGTDIYDWSIEGRLRQFKEHLEKFHPSEGEVIPLHQGDRRELGPGSISEEIGEVLTVGDRDRYGSRP